MACRGPAYRSSGPRLSGTGEAATQGALGLVGVARARGGNAFPATSAPGAAGGRVDLRSTAAAALRRRSYRSEGLLRPLASIRAAAVGMYFPRNQTPGPQTAAVAIDARMRQVRSARV